MYLVEGVEILKDKEVISCGIKSPDPLCIRKVSSYLERCGFNNNGSVYWTYSDGVYIKWSLSKRLLYENLLLCNVSVKGKNIRLLSSLDALNALFVSLAFMLIPVLPFLLTKKERSSR